MPRVVDEKHTPTDRSRKQVERMAACGLSPVQIAHVLGTSLAEVKRHYELELEHGTAAVTAKVGASLVRQALRGDVAAARFFLQSRARWSVPTAVELTGKDGGPVEVAEGRALVDSVVALVGELQAKAQGQPGPEQQPAVKPH